MILGEADLEKMLRDRARSEKNGVPKVRIPTDIVFDDACSAHSTLVQVVTQDRPGLLHRIASQFGQHQCNIEIALIDTEGQMAIDVFYLTHNGGKLTSQQQEKLRQALLTSLKSD